MSSLTPLRRITIAAATLGTSAAVAVVGYAPTASAAGTTVTPNPVANSGTQQLTITGDTLAPAYVLSPAVTLYGPGVPSSGVDGTGTTDDGTTIKTTFNFANIGGVGAPLGPGSYTLAIGLSGLTSSKLDTVGLTVTGPTPDPSASLAIEPTGSVSPATITSPTGAFATGDAVGVVDGSTAVAGLTFTNATITAGTITGTLAATNATPAGTYDLVVTDTSGQKGTCAGCVTVTNGPTVVRNLEVASSGPTGATLTWDPPADESAPSFVGYNVVVSTSPSATSTDSGITVTQPSDQSDPKHTGATVTGLTTGTTYHVSVTATDSVGTSPAATTSFATPYATSLTFDATKPQVVFGQSVTVSGLLLRSTSSGDQAIPRATVYIVAKHKHTKAQVFRQLTTDSNGDYSTTFTPGKNATYAAYYGGKVSSAGKPGDVPAFSLAAAINVAPKVTITKVSKKSYHLAAFSVTGKVAPGARGQKVYLVLVDALGNHKTLAYVTVGKGSVFKFHEAVLRKKGTYHLQVQIPAHGNSYVAGKSKPFVLKRT